MKLKLSRVSDWMTSRDKKQNPIRIEWSNHSWIAWVWNYYIIHWLEAAISAISINQVLGRWHIIMLYVCAQLNHERCSTAWTAKKKNISRMCSEQYLRAQTIQQSLHTHEAVVSAFLIRHYPAFCGSNTTYNTQTHTKQICKRRRRTNTVPAIRRTVVRSPIAVTTLP